MAVPFVTSRVSSSTVHNALPDVTACLESVVRYTPERARLIIVDDGSEEPTRDFLREFSLPAYCDDDDEEANTYPFRNFLWLPLRLRDGTVFAGILAAREQVWLEADNVVAKRLAGCFAHAWSALSGSYRNSRKRTSACNSRFGITNSISMHI